MPTSQDGSVPAEDAPRSATTGAKYFVTTHWSVVLTAGRSDTTRAGAALEQLCRGYWHPLYHFIRRRGHAPADAQDLTQEFFARLLARQAVAEANPDRGRFRSFLLGSLKHFLADEWDKARAQKRGGGQMLPLDFASEESRLTHEPVETDTPETAYERRWALALLEQVYRRLEEEFGRAGKEKHFAVLRVALTGERSAVPYAELGRQLNTTEAAVKMAVHRLRQRYRELLREAIADTVSGPEEVADELRYLLQILAR
jgi:RNA polymerase sigma-70 factor (ECF subfamily)